MEKEGDKIMRDKQETLRRKPEGEMSCRGRKLSSCHIWLSLKCTEDEEMGGGGELSEKEMEAEIKADGHNRPPVGWAQIAECGDIERREH